MEIPHYLFTKTERGLKVFSLAVVSEDNNTTTSHGYSVFQCFVLSNFTSRQIRGNTSRLGKALYVFSA